MHLRSWLALPIAGVLLAALAVFYWLGLTSVAGVVHDDVVYLVTGKALAESGAYRIISQPGEPFQIAYPPLYPAAIAVLWKLFPAFPANLWAFKALNVACALACVVLTYVLVTRTYGAPRSHGWMAAGLLAVSSYYVSFMDLTMSEMLFSVFLVGALILLERLPERSDAHKAWVPLAIGLVATLPCMVRTISITLVGAMLVWLLLRRQWKLAIASAASMVAWQLPWQGWIWYVKTHAVASWDYMGWMNANSEGLSLLSLISNVPGNAWALLKASVPLAVAPMLQHELLARLHQPMGLPGFTPILALAVTGVVAAGLIRTAVPRPRLYHLFLAAYVGLLLIFPWDPTRYMMAVSPLLLYAFVEGAWWLADTRPPSGPAWQRRTARVLAVGLIALSSASGAARVLSFARNQTFHDALLPASAKVQQADEAALADWARGHVPADSLWLHHRDPLMFLMTGRKALTYGDGPDPVPANRALFRAHPTYMVLYPEPMETFTKHHALLKAHPDKLTLVFEPPGRSFKVYKLAPEWP